MFSFTRWRSHGGGDNGASRLPCARSRPLRHIRDRLASGSAHRRVVDVDGPGECPAIIRGVSRDAPTRFHAARPHGPVGAVSAPGRTGDPSPGIRRTPRRTAGDTAAAYPAQFTAPSPSSAAHQEVGLGRHAGSRPRPVWPGSPANAPTTLTSAAGNGRSSRGPALVIRTKTGIGCD
jgi:hypothetical protein